MAKKNKIGGNQRIRKSSKRNVTKWRGSWVRESYLIHSKYTEIMIIKKTTC